MRQSRAGAQRQELEVSVLEALAVGVPLAVLTVLGASLLPPESYLRQLLLERGPIQYIVLLLAWTVVGFVGFKFARLQREYPTLLRSWVPATAELRPPSSSDVGAVCRDLERSRYVLETRCYRVLATYWQTQSGKQAAEQALDDSSFYQAAANGSYAFPRILVTAIPLLGFVGTVVGISNAVAGFSGFLDAAADVDSLREGIGNVTTGLGVAFDTTLLALALSVAVMVPLALVERAESRLLLNIDIYITDRVLPRLDTAPTETSLAPDQMRTVVAEAVSSQLPDAETLLQPAREYAERAALDLAEIFATEVAPVRATVAELLDKLSAYAEGDRERHQILSDAIAQQGETGLEAFREAIAELQRTNATLIEELRAGNTAAADQLQQQTAHIAAKLEQAASALDMRVANLERLCNEANDIARLQENLERALRDLQTGEQLGATFAGLREHLAELKPVLEQLRQPRRIVLMERDD